MKNTKQEAKPEVERLKKHQEYTDKIVDMTLELGFNEIQLVSFFEVIKEIVRDESLG